MAKIHEGWPEHDGSDAPFCEGCNEQIRRGQAFIDEYCVPPEKVVVTRQMRLHAERLAEELSRMDDARNTP